MVHGLKIDEGISRAEEERRSRKRTDKVVQNHFFGEFGLEAELVDAGIMHPETKVRSAAHLTFVEVGTGKIGFSQLHPKVDVNAWRGDSCYDKSLCKVSEANCFMVASTRANNAVFFSRWPGTREFFLVDFGALEPQ
mmetsp:Transcript_10887/g.31615  ORF Transcript_10887/g.31615 Transcript_10887/m.31615 type:complete len:137 (-) Transcript_10887:3-413(-)